MKKQYDITKYQMRFWLEWKIDPKTTAYNTPLIYKITGTLDKNALICALDKFVNYYDEGCRTTFVEVADIVKQTIYDNIPIDLLHENVKEDDPEKAKKIDLFIRSITNFLFDLSSPPLFKFGLLSCGANEHLLVLNFHHIITDALSARFFIKYLSVLYNYFAFNSPLPPLEQFTLAHYMQMENQAKAENESDKDLVFWEEKLIGKNLFVHLPLENNIDIENKYAKSLYFSIDSQLFNKLKHFVRKESTTIFITLAAVFGILLSRYSNQEDIVLNYPVDRRPAGKKNLTGCFVNNLPLVVDIRSAKYFVDLVKQITLFRKESKIHQDSSLTDIVQRLRNNKILHDDKFLNVNLIEAYLDHEPLAFENLTVIPIKRNEIEIDVDLSLAYQITECIQFRLDYHDSNFSKEFIKNFVDNFIYLIEECISYPAIELCNTGCVNKEQKKAILAYGNLNSRSAENSKHDYSVITLFEEQVKKTPNNIAVIDKSNNITYKELYEEVNQLANYIRELYKNNYKRDLSDGVLIGVCMARGINLVKAILAILKSGAAYVPLDPEYPHDRLQTMLEDSAVSYIITQSEYVEKLQVIKKYQSIVIPMDCIDLSANMFTTSTTIHMPLSNNLVYVIYTSGSTGKPKGVMIEHENLINVILYFKQKLQIKVTDALVSTTSMNFDIFGLELFLPLVSGSQLIIVDDNLLNNGVQLKQYLQAIQPTIIQGTPALWSLLHSVEWEGDQNQLIILCGGDLLPPQVAQYILQISKQTIQVYGPTETTIWSTAYVLDDKVNCSVIGKPIDNTHVLILDKNKKLLPVGVPGELYIGGKGVARGYWKQLQLTYERFISSKTIKELDGIQQVKTYYRTGDRVCWNHQGELKFINRMDNQIKLRGYRIELGEIESCLMKNSLVKHAVVIPQEEGLNKFLVAYIVLTIENYNNSDICKLILDSLSKELPYYMLPKVFIYLDKLPLTPNGKIDRKKLSKMDNSLITKEITPAKNQLEKELLDIWQEVFSNRQLGIDDNFFELGGHSLLAIKIISRVSNKYHTEFSVKMLYQNQNIRDLAQAIAKLHTIPTPSQIHIKRHNNKNTFPLTSSQKRIWFIEQIETTQNHLHNIMVVHKLTGDLNSIALIAALKLVIARHDSLRSIIKIVKANPYQVINNFKDICLNVEKIDNTNLEQLLQNEAKYNFDIDQGPLYKIRLLQTSENEHVLIVTLHHLIADGWTLNILNEEIRICYEAISQNKSPDLPDLKYQYGDYVEWQRESLQGENLQKLTTFWQNYLHEYTDLMLPSDYKSSAERSYEGNHQYFFMDQEIITKLNKFSRSHQATFFNILMVAYAILLNKYTDQTDILIGSPIANRDQQGFENIVGFFANTVVFRIKLTRNQVISQLIAQVVKDSFDIYANQNMPFEQLIDLLDIKRDLSRTPLFQVMLAYQTANDSHQLNLPNIRSEYIPVEDNISKFDLLFTFIENKQNKTMMCCIEYSTQLFKPKTIERIFQHFINILTAILQDPLQRVGEIPVLSNSEQEVLLNQWYRKQNVIQPNKTLTQIFNEQVQKYPDNIALSYLNENMTYLELNARSNRIARAIRDKYLNYFGKNLEPDTLIGLCIDRGMSLIVGILAILKAGGAYVPLDPDYPSERLLFIVKDSNVPLILTNRKTAAVNDIVSTATQSAFIYTDDNTIHYSDDELLPIHNPASLAYVIYTSGSTGNPKGVLSSHHNVSRLFKVNESNFEFREHDVWTLFHSYAFDFSVWEMWGALLHGGRLVIISYEMSRDPDAFYHHIYAEKVTVLNQTPSSFLQLLNTDKKQDKKNHSLRYVILGGESLAIALLRPWLEKYHDEKPQLINMYGITETTVHVTFRRITMDDLDSAIASPIGLPLNDLSVYVLDSDKQLVPVGIPGELYIGGDGLARGYQNRPELTASRFLVNPFYNAQFPNAPRRLYKTGDVVRWLDNGELEYYGRNDQQVKIRGYRIELSEIENALLKIPHIKFAVVIPRDINNEKQLVVYYLADHTLDKNIIYQKLKSFLPIYMIPSYYIPIEEIPLTINGKLNADKLPNVTQEQHQNNITILLSPTEEILLSIFSEVTGYSNIKINDNFFTIGGDSIRSIEVVNRARDYAIQFTPKQLFQNPTVASLSRNINKSYINDYMSIAKFGLLKQSNTNKLPKDLEDAYPLTTLQEGMIFHSEYNKNSATYRDVLGCFIAGPYNEPMLLEILNSILNQHEILRTSFNLYDYSQPLQLVHKYVNLSYQVFDISNLTSQQQYEQLSHWLINEKNKRFDLDRAPLWRITVHLLDKQHFHFGLTCHHAILDGWSVAQLITQIFEGYEKKLSCIAIDFKVLASRFSHYVAFEQNLKTSEKQRNFWKNKLLAVDSTLLADYSCNIDKTKIIKRKNIAIEQVYVQALLNLAQRFETSIDTILLAIHLRVLAMINNTASVITGLSTHGRLAEKDSIQVLGLFLNSTPFVINIGRQSWSELIINVKKEKECLLQYQDYPLNEILRLHNGIVFFDTLFNFINFHVFSGLKSLTNIKVSSHEVYEETNYTLITQTGFNQLDNNLMYELIYNSSILDEQKLEKIAKLSEYCIQSIVNEVDLPYVQYKISELLINKTPLTDWHHAQSNYPKDKNLQQLFSIQAKKFGDCIAVESADSIISYSNLESQSNQLAHAIRELYQKQYGTMIEADTLIGLSLERGIELIISMLAILKAGGAYVPLDPDYPTERLQSIIDDSGIKLLVTNEDILHKQSIFVAFKINKTICVNHTEKLQKYSKEEVVQVNAANDLAYVIYTSGSTGKPKGVMIEHHSVSRLVLDTNYIKIKPIDCIAHAANINFDASTFEIWGALLNGAKLLCIKREQFLDTQTFANLLLEHKVTILWLTARYFDQLVENGFVDALKHLDTLLIGGDILNKNSIDKLFKCTAGRPNNIINGYGPTENTTFTTTYLITPESMIFNTIPIGSPISNTGVYVLNSQKEEVPIGTVGELYICGDGLARGYLNKPEATNSSFIEVLTKDCSNNSKLLKMFHSGDLVRWMPDGNLEFIGRSDRQIKIRGYRVELDEIEAIINTEPGVKQSVVETQKNDNHIKIIAYCTIDSSLLNANLLRDRLTSRLPSFMMPSRIIILDSLPLTENGKINHKFLPYHTQDLNPDLNQQTFTPIESQLFNIWKEVLGHSNFTSTDNFFDSGGDSLLAMQLHGKLIKNFNKELSIIDIFKYPTVKSLAQYLENKDISMLPDTYNATYNIQARKKAAQAQLLKMRDLRLKSKENRQ